jgi:hypothetical protein
MSNPIENEQYMKRLKRFTDAVSLKGPDRVPVIPINVHLLSQFVSQMF